jgi:hypothetical protein
MAASHQLRLGAFMRPVSIHTAWWRYLGAFPDANFNFEHLKRLPRPWSAVDSTRFSWPTCASRKPYRDDARRGVR